MVQYWSLVGSAYIGQYGVYLLVSESMLANVASTKSLLRCKMIEWCVTHRLYMRISIVDFVLLLAIGCVKSFSYHMPPLLVDFTREPILCQGLAS